MTAAGASDAVDMVEVGRSSSDDEGESANDLSEDDDNGDIDQSQSEMFRQVPRVVGRFHNIFTSPVMVHFPLLNLGSQNLTLERMLIDGEHKDQRGHSLGLLSSINLQST
jgi:hypothetical protein